ncbi:glycosyltransferase family 4 protein [Macrococcoides canis]|uniref:glycosyltransferase family 4 protein n=1 Tax=Macrococcoides canis TaxID=1855823 RepID=UPI0010FC20A6|nr:glycosyltransferase family 4 protein [Macrococcus canis]QCT74502.1 glycosyltransferase [Macrococcus canis]
MKIALFTTAYPNENNYYNHGFIHSRVIEYMKKNINLKMDIFVVNRNKKLEKYVYEGVQVYSGNKKVIEKIFNINEYHKIVVHFLDHKIIDILNKLKPKKEILVWVHGHEALSWRRRQFNKNENNFYKYIISNKLQLYKMKKFVQNHSHVKYIFVSNWMKKVMEQDVKVRVNDYVIIPNVINTDYFSYQKKNVEDRTKILTIRPFTSRKYATDIVTKAIEELSKEFEYFNELSFTIIGKGPLFEEDTSSIKYLENVELINKFIHPKEIKEYHKKNGIFLIPTRQDSQGVSMCEAMSSGLVPIASNNTAIPEFLNEKAGYLTNNINEVKNAIIDLYYNKEKFLDKSKHSSKIILEKCSPEKTIDVEYELIMK